MSKHLTWEEAEAQFDWEYVVPKKQADILRQWGVPPPPTSPEKEAFLAELRAKKKPPTDPAA